MGDEDVPPLEDLTDVLTRHKNSRPQPRYEPRSRMRSENTEKPSPAAAKSERQSFGGFASGFLLSSSSSSSAAKTSSSSKKKRANERASTEKASPGSEKERDGAGDIPFVKAQAPQGKAPVIPEVQEAMKDAYSLMDTQEWMTDSLLEKIEEHPLLSRALRDPTLAQALSLFQTDPESVLRTAAGNPQLQEVLKEFCSLMGTHLTDLADRQESEKHGKNFVPLPKDEEVDEVLGKEGVKEALSDPQIQKLFSLLKDDDSSKAQRMLSSAGPELREKVQRLIDNGLLALQ